MLVLAFVISFIKNNRIQTSVNVGKQRNCRNCSLMDCVPFAKSCDLSEVCFLITVEGYQKKDQYATLSGSLRFWFTTSICWHSHLPWFTLIPLSIWSLTTAPARRAAEQCEINQPTLNMCLLPCHTQQLHLSKKLYWHMGEDVVSINETSYLYKVWFWVVFPRYRESLGSVKSLLVFIITQSAHLNTHTDLCCCNH